MCIETVFASSDVACFATSVKRQADKKALLHLVSIICSKRCPLETFQSRMPLKCLRVERLLFVLVQRKKLVPK